MKILVAYRGVPQSPGWETGSYLVSAFRALGHDVCTYGWYYQTPRLLPDHYQGGALDLAVILEMNDGDPQYAELPSLPCPRVYWEFDTAMHEEATRALLSHLRPHHLFMANAKMAERYGARYLPYAVDSSHHRPHGQAKRGAAIVGSAFPARVAFASSVGIPVLANLFRSDYVCAIDRLSVHVHHFASGGDGLLVMRVWETLGIGTCLLTERTPQIPPDMPCLTFGSADECRAALGAMLADPDRAKSLGEEGRQWVLAKHTYEDRARTILEAVR